MKDRWQQMSLKTTITRKHLRGGKCVLGAGRSMVHMWTSLWGRAGQVQKGRGRRGGGMLVLVELGPGTELGAEQFSSHFLVL